MDDFLAACSITDSKLCPKCGRTRPLDCFHRSPINRSGRASYCKDCRSANAKVYNVEHRDYNHAMYMLNQEREIAYAKEYSQRPEVKERERANKYMYMRKPETRVRRNARYHERYKTDPKFRLAESMRARVKMALKRRRKLGLSVPAVGHKLDLLGCTMEAYMAHISRQWLPGMSWNNYGDWHIDHIIPVGTFDLLDEKQLHVAFHYSNTRPLWATENLSRPKKLTQLVA